MPPVPSWSVASGWNKSILMGRDDQLVEGGMGDVSVAGLQIRTQRPARAFFGHQGCGVGCML